MYNSTEIAKKINFIAKDKKIPVSKILVECNLAKNTISNMLHGRALSSDSLAKIADYLDCSVDYLLGRTDETNFSNKKRSTSDLTEAELECLDLFCQLTDIDKGKCLSEMEHILKRYPPEKQEWIS